MSDRDEKAVESGRPAYMQDGDILVEPYYPRDVQYIYETGGHHYIGLVNQSTVLKYPHFKGELDSVRAEQRILEHLGKHDRIIKFQGEHEDGILLELAGNGSVEDYLAKNQPSRQQRIQMAQEVAEGVAYVHSCNVLLCDIHVRNLLLDGGYHVKLCDFAGRLLDAEGQVVVDGGAIENAEAFMPRGQDEVPSQASDIFALGSAIYHIMTGHRPFTEYDVIDDEMVITEQYRNGKFPQLDTDLCGQVVYNCWKGLYISAEQVYTDLSILGI